MKYIYCALLCLLACPSFSQDNIKFSDPISLPLAGWNKILVMKNGNTMLFHLEPDKEIHVIVFDSSRKKIADHLCPTKILNTGTLPHSSFEGLFNINNEAVLFLQQDIYSKNSLIRLCFNAGDGNLVSEKIVMQGKGVLKPSRFFVIMDPNSDNYSVFCNREILLHADETLELVRFNKKHEAVNIIPIDLNRKEYDYLDYLGTEILPQGTFICLSARKIKAIGGSEKPIYDHFLSICYIPADTEIVISKTINLLDRVSPYSFQVTYNPFAQSFNFLLLSFKNETLKEGLVVRPVADIDHILVVIDANTFSFKYNLVKNTMVTAAIQKYTDTNHVYEGIPLKMFTNEYGLTTAIFQEYGRNWDNADRSRYFLYTYLGKIGITRFDDNGKEISGYVVPKSQFITSYSQYVSPGQLPGTKGTFWLFTDQTEAAFREQFASVNSYTANKNFFMIYNDNAKNINSSLEKPCDSVYDYSISDAFVSKMDRHGTITKTYLLGQPNKNESKSTFIQSGLFDDKSGMYTSLVLYRKGKDITTHLAWCHLN